ncbi:MAG TPA: aminomethyl-transferring glycine dehydrogenase subunit GcvPA [Clostridiales bacterium]|jgi:glycine dehydrogenase subunit 1|nr:aminomethyl-transferring glycine dehydrogenase subunit GcvPA [Clostridiales bacterium]
MFPYLPATPEDEKIILERLGLNATEEIFRDIPESVRLKRDLKLDDPKSELEMGLILKSLSRKNWNADSVPMFLGAGVYDHYIPSTVRFAISRSEFYTAYTPYQPEISQGTLQVIFEYQTMICNLTEMDVSNASLYDGASAATEAAFMAAESTRRRQILVSETVHPDTRRVLSTYMGHRGLELITIPMKDGVTDSERMRDAISDKTAAVLIQTPNFLGYLEEITEVEKQIHKNKGLLILSVDPISLGLFKSPGEWGADIAIGDGQSLGNSMSFGGPGLGFMACTKALMRKMPGRIVGQTRDIDGNRGFVSTLQAREQHIRREKATSNICSNQALNALAATVYLTTMGKHGLQEAARHCYDKAHYAASLITESGKYQLAYKKPFFKEFPIISTVTVHKIQSGLLQKGMIGGYSLNQDYPALQNGILYCVTEKRTKQEIDCLVQALEEIE